jgi:hypothetical protein
VDSRPDELLLKGKFAIQTQPSGRRSTMVRTRVQQIWKLRVADQPSGWPSPMVRTREALVKKLLAADVRPSAIVPHRLVTALKQERFSAKISEFWLHSCSSGRPMTIIQTAPSFIKSDTHLSPQPINRGPYA